ITNQLSHERGTLCSSGVVDRCLDDVRRWAQETKLADGRRVIDQEWVQLNLARVHARLEFLRLINWKVAWSSTKKRLEPADASATKVFGTEFYLEAFRLLSEVIGQVSYLRDGSPEAVLRSRLERNYRSLLILTFGGGGNEVQRDLIAACLLGIALPEHAGGAGLGFVALGLVLEQVGRTVAPVPIMASIVLGGLAVAEFGTRTQQEALLPGVVSGDTILTAALVELGAEPAHPTTTARPES